MSQVVNINEVLEGHVALEVDCVDRLYINGYVPNLQVGGQVRRFCDHLGQSIPSPVVVARVGNRFRAEVDRFARARRIPVLHLKKPDRSRWDDRKLDHVRPYLDAAQRAGRTGVVAIVAAQEYQWVFSATKKTAVSGPDPWFDWHKAERRVSCFYFYIYDGDFGPCFIKICSYMPWPAKLWCNGHEWAKRQARRARIDFRDLSNGFASCERPERLQAVCDSLGPGEVQGLFERWICRIPTPLSPADREGGFWWQLSMRQVEVSRTVVFDDPRRARAFFESLVADNIGIGRPEKVSMVFARRVTKRTPEDFRARVFTAGTQVQIDFSYKHSRVKQYLKEGRAFRVETVINKPSDIGILARLEHMPELVDAARQVNQRVLMIERAGQGCAIGSALFERIHQPYAREGQRTGAFRFGDNRAMALAGALCAVIHAVTGFTNHSLRGLVAGQLGTDYTSAQMTYDLRRLRLHGLIQRVPHTNTYVLTPDGQRVAAFYTKLHRKLLGPLLDADKPPAPIEVRRALAVIDKTVNDYVTNARLGTAA
jgi:hypothetical protein